jgi:hypothetical protein
MQGCEQGENLSMRRGNRQANDKTRMKAKLLKLMLPAAVAMGFCAITSELQASFIQLGRTNYLQNFNTLDNHGKGTALPAGWALLGVGNVGNFYIADDGSDLNGGVKSYGKAGTQNRALGVNTQANGNSGIFGADFQNAGPGSISSLNISYTGEEWRLGVAGHQNTLQFQYSLNAGSLSSGTWINVPSLSFSTPNVNGVGAHDGTLAVNQVPVSSVISFLNIPAGATFWIRWKEVGTPMGVAGDGLAVDNFSLTAVPEASTYAAAFLAFGLLGRSLWKHQSISAKAGVFGLGSSSGP